MALRNSCGRHIDARSTPHNRRIVNLDKKTREEVIAIIENLSNKQWQILTRDLDNITREEFAMVCVGIVQQLTDATYKRSKLANSHEKTFARAAPHPSTVVSPLESPQGNAVTTAIMQEVKLALSAALDNSVSGKDSSSAITEGWSALFLQLEEETLNVLTARLDSSDFFARITKASCSSGEDAQLDSEPGLCSIGLTVSSDEDTMESSGEQPEAAAATNNAVEEDMISFKEEEVTTACTNEVISQICDVYKSAELEAERLRAAREREEELSLLTSHFVDNVMIQLKELSSVGKSVAFRWVPKDVWVPASVWASSAADQNILSPQFQIAAQQKVSKVLRQSMSGEAPLGHVPSVATDIVGTIVRSLTNLPHSIGSLRSAEDRDDTTGTAQNIYHNVQSKVNDFLWSKKINKKVSDSESSEGTLAYDTESSCGTGEEEVEEDDEEETSMEGEDFHLKSSNDGVPLSHIKPKENQIKTVPEVSWSRSKGGSTSEQRTPRRKADLELDLSKTNQHPEQTTPASRTSQHSRRLPSIDVNATTDYLRKLLCCVQADGQVRAEDITNLTKAETSTLHNTSKSHNSDIIVIMETTNYSETLVDSAPGSKANLELDAGTQCSEETLSASRTAHPVGQLPPIDRNTTRDYWRILLCCIKSEDQVKTEDVTEAGTSTFCNVAESHVSDIILIMDRETSLDHM
ncbi:uncharacterized protein LOC134082226 isoform X2 [Sardina pilchardus]